MSEFEVPAFYPITSMTSSDDECDECEGNSSTTQPGTAMPSGAAVASIEELDSLADCQSQGCVALH